MQPTTVPSGASPARGGETWPSSDTPARPGAGLDLSRLIIAIDGPSGSGKSTVSRRVAQRLGLRYLDTGAMYRAVTWQALEESLDLGSDDALSSLAARLRLEVGTNPRRPTVAVGTAESGAVDVGRAIRTREVTNAVSAVSAIGAVRSRMLAEQRVIIGRGGIVVEGRDIGTTVAPEAPVKVFLTASGDARARRRHRQLSREEPGSALEQTHDELVSRDERDSTRVASPLVKSPDAIEIDSTHLPVGEVVAAVLEQCRALGVAVPRPQGRKSR